MDPILNNLNPKQREAVTAEPGNLLVLAGAGSGKTRVLVHRLAWLLQHYHISPHHVLAVTFTNKAAHEMKGRIESLFNLSSDGLWVGTFHGLAHRLLRMHYAQAKLPQTFQVLDADDQYRLVRRILKDLGLDENQWSPRQAQGFINRQKENGLRPGKGTATDDVYDVTMTKIYDAYQKRCDHNGLVDFAELLLRSYELLQNNLELRTQYQQRFEHILVDEFQDTNTIQYRWLKSLMRPGNFMMVVGDDDQSIYAWRGAKIENIQRFQAEFDPVHLIRLEQNYRSTQTILNAANAVIQHNPDRLGKNLWTEGDAGHLIQLYAAFNELDEARFIIARIQSALHEGLRRRDITILYRSNAQSRVFEEAFLQAGIPYHVYGGQRFFERAEIKDALAYLRLIHNRHDDSAFERIVNTPTRGIGNACVDTLRQLARSQGCSLWQASELAVSPHQTILATRAVNALQKFLAMIDGMDDCTHDASLSEQTETAIKQSGLIEYYQKTPGEKGQSRLENLAELVTAAKQFTPIADDPAQVNMTPLAAFLSHAVLESGENNANKHEDSVQLMTLHTAKGLEFPLVFMAGMEEQIFPSRPSIEDPQRLAEERRLCYVGMTRAMRQLFMTYAEYRRLYGESRQHFASRFINEIPEEYVQEVRMRTSITRPVSVQPTHSPKRFRTSASGLTTNGKTWQVGQRLSHPKFGEGIIVNYEGQGDNGRLQIHFTEAGTKWIIPSCVTLESV